MSGVKILYLGCGSQGTTSFHRFSAIERQGYDVEMLSVLDLLPFQNRIAKKCDYLLGHRLIQKSLLRNIRAMTLGSSWDIVWVDSGWWCGHAIADFLHTIGRKVVLLCNDDPYGNRERSHWLALQKAIPTFDLCAVFRDPTADDFRNAGARNVMRLSFGYDEHAHHPDRSSGIPAEEYLSEVCFIGTQMEDRSSFMIGLLQRGIPISIWGNQWEKSENWPKLKSHWRGNGIVGDHYVAAIKRSKICIGLLSKGNRDEHTQRSVEIPYAGGLLCAERTAEHETMYRDGVEAVFFDNVDDCADKCLSLLQDHPRRTQIQNAGRIRVQDLRVGNEVMTRSIIENAINV